MAQFKYREEIEEVWEKAEICNCNNEDCHNNNHRLCGICKGTIIYGAHESVKEQNNSGFAWNIDHIEPKSLFYNIGFTSNLVSVNDISNKRAVHIKCNREKGNKY